MNFTQPFFRQRRAMLAVWLSVPSTTALLSLTGCDSADASDAPRVGAVTPVPAPALDVTAPSNPPAARQTAVFAGGCFWGIQAVFQRIKGVASATSGYAGGAAKFADYHSVSTGSTGHAEAVQVVFDPSKVSYGQLLQVFMSVAHDPTQLNAQGPDTGTQYRSVIFTTSDEQARVAHAYIAQLDAAKVFPSAIVTQVTALNQGPQNLAFYPAEDYHQDYLDKHPTQMYIVINDKPKIEALARTFPSLYRPGKTDGKALRGA